MHAALIFKNLNFSLIPSQKHLAWRVTSTSAEAMPSLSIKKNPKNLTSFAPVQDHKMSTFILVSTHPDCEGFLRNVCQNPNSQYDALPLGNNLREESIILINSINGLIRREHRDPLALFQHVSLQ